MREITIRFDCEDPDRYADIANVLWAQMNATGCDFTVTLATAGDAAAVDRRWDDYSTVSWGPVVAGAPRRPSRPRSPTLPRRTNDDPRGGGRGALRQLR
ncbi:hypothetical protein [Micromonospora sp. RP3T]|uniref:hypothetical protein n=1 Tax=Micromonospora sp. RP3T TaxID=2135446 RepID=UPI0011B26F8E|nr:hypothetical protein [Micromonospora sp. RP3T]